MTLRIHHIRLRVQTDSGLFGADIPLTTGLNVLWADNTRGKSTCLQGLLYVLGLERMLSPRRDIPLTYVMTSHLEDPETGERHNVVESYVAAELENGAGEIITVQRNVVATGDRKLVSVINGPALTKPEGQYTQRDFFVHDPGAARREAGFHRFLAEFIAWDLPTVRCFDGSETLLYLETVFPLLYVEQKAGWSAVPAAFPTYFQIRDVGRRAVEFLMGLQTHELDLKRQQLEMGLAGVRAAWSAKRDELRATAEIVGARVEGVPAAPTAVASDLNRAFLAVASNDTWIPLDDFSSTLRGQVDQLRREELPTVEEVADEANTEIDRLTETAASQNLRRSALFRARQAEQAQSASIVRRLEALEEDLQKNLDAQKLRNFGSKIAETAAADHCPTCAQPIQDTLLAQRAGAAVMPITENIEYIRSQRSIFMRLQERSGVAISDLERQLLAATEEVNATNALLRALRADVVAPAHSPSIAMLETRLRLEARLQALDDVQQRFEQQRGELVGLANQQATLLAERSELPRDRFTADDRAKLTMLTELVRQQAARYGFSTFAAGEIEISEDNYRPQKEGFEIGFELSASDAIRLKWAYQLALLELARSSETNHPGFVVFDEPRQQETAKVSFSRLLERAAEARKASQQVIFATSEDRDQLTTFLKGIDCQLLVFEGRMVRRLPS